MSNRVKTKRPHLAVVKHIEKLGINYELSKYLPSKDNIYINGQPVRIKENYLHFSLGGDLKNFTYCLYFSSPADAVRRIVEYFTKYGGGVPAVSPTTGNKCVVLYEKNKLYYKKVA
ncbi:MAG: hypothetical protein DI598_17560 [Pseudopedobacter saltans]|uniref:Uncharacterized protein n=1 Tax=Pseudopedobacter saltans TaxID=151895 RepID=A0A2W5G8W9_9SPHI|nr:MAG: hypothetical protein DI598_17560 [Pseudopedobacter saltans]